MKHILFLLDLGTRPVDKSDTIKPFDPTNIPLLPVATGKICEASVRAKYDSVMTRPRQTLSTRDRQ